MWSQCCSHPLYGVSFQAFSSLCDFVFREETLTLIQRYLEDSLYNWLDEELENFTDDDYLVFDCPGVSTLAYSS